MVPIKGAHKSVAVPPLGSSDLNIVHLLPTYQTVLHREQVLRERVDVKSEDSALALQAGFDCTNWSVFVDMIVPVVKCPNLKALNDSRPVTLTSLVMKTFEKVIKQVVQSESKCVACNPVLSMLLITAILNTDFTK